MEQVGYGDGMNFPLYVGNDPVNHTDPSDMHQAARMHPQRPRRVGLGIL